MRRKNKPKPCRCAKIERRRTARFEAWTEEWRSLLLPYLPRLPALVSELRAAAGQLERAALQASESFDGIRLQARAALGGRSQELEREIARVMVALQFQDIVNQKITHAIDTLTRLDADLDRSLGRPLPQARSKRGAEGASYSTLRGAPQPTGDRPPCGRSGAVKGSEVELGGDIEIFLPEVNS